MPEIDFEKLMKLAADPKVGENAESLQGLLKDAEKVLSFAEKVIKVVDRAGGLPGLVRAVGKKYDVDVETPLRTQHGEDGIIPVSEFHKKVFEEMNNTSEKDLKKQFEEAAKVMKEHEARKPGSGSAPGKKPDTA